MIDFNVPLTSPTAKTNTVRWFLRTSNLVALDPEALSPTADLYQKYVDWCGTTSRHPMNNMSFGKALSRLGSPVVRTTGGKRLRGGLRIL